MSRPAAALAPYALTALKQLMAGHAGNAPLVRDAVPSAAEHGPDHPAGARYA
jgi:hypothetical protein